VYVKMKIGNTIIDWADVGNACLIVGTGVAFYGASVGNLVFGVEAVAVGGALKAVGSAIDNMLFKKAQVPPVASTVPAA
jgi:hypothetical protein